MAWSISDIFPSWGSTGESPGDGFQYDGGDQVNEKHFDYLWASANSLENEVRSALSDIDADGDGVVDEADSANLYKGTDIDTDGDGTVDSADDATNVTSTYKGNDIDSNGDGTVDAADDSTTLQGNSPADLQVDVTDDGTAVLSNVDSMDFGSNVSVADDGDGTVTVSAATSTTSVPTGAIALWSGSIANIPSGWVLCDGNNGTPNLQDRFVVGAGSAYGVNDTGGADSVTLSTSQIPSHGHSASESSVPDHAHSTSFSFATDFDRTGGGTGVVDVGSGTDSASTSNAGGHTPSVSIGTTGGDGSHENRPPYHALAYIQKT